MQRGMAWVFPVVAAVGLFACGGSGGGDLTFPEVEKFMGLKVGQGSTFDVNPNLAGEISVTEDGDYVSGTKAFKLSYFINGLPASTRWFTLKGDGLYALGEEVKEASQFVSRKYVDPVKFIAYPLQKGTGVPVLRWTTTTDLVGGGRETHLFDNSGVAARTVPAGTFQAYHILHTRTPEGKEAVSLDMYFVPETGLIELEYPEGTVWKQK